MDSAAHTGQATMVPATDSENETEQAEVAASEDIEEAAEAAGDVGAEVEPSPEGSGDPDAAVAEEAEQDKEIARPAEHHLRVDELLKERQRTRDVQLAAPDRLDSVIEIHNVKLTQSWTAL